jgi:hypothetical protein
MKLLKDISREEGGEVQIASESDIVSVEPDCREQESFKYIL